MNAIEMLKQQHREVDELFEEFEAAGEGARKTRERLCREIADALAVHATIEERIFYPEAKEAAEDAEDLLRESVEEHLSVKRLLAQLLESSVDDPQLEARMSVLKEQVEHHVEEEEKELFPKVRKACSAEQLDEMGSRMQKLVEELEEQGQPSASIPDETDEPAPI
ncbi:hemerythrin domain-containing protein [Anaeromyxobacter dehalogenans]|uniref:Hemerythrin HHE cation binding protein n=1 Tax=Anaeromyxobacter dehalogenans (strain 2CP-C) TaxID=290397 RepID=Q2IQU6_ANADE|nr:hemerythrin domain-containing protein [Anaeromyxobacter dehalogenans]ABC81178.1 Hemerythrin HHE cation binding protein [Anaeromyxobacter dehalogenans 2CP-C]